MPDIIVVDRAEDGLAECDMFMLNCSPSGNFFTGCINEFVHPHEVARSSILTHAVDKCRYGKCFGMCFDTGGELGTPYDAFIVSKSFGPGDVTEDRLRAVARLLNPTSKSIKTPFQHWLDRYLEDTPDWFSGSLYLELNPSEYNQKLVKEVFQDSPVLNIYFSERPFGNIKTYEELFPSWRTPRNLKSLDSAIRKMTTMWM